MHDWPLRAHRVNTKRIQEMEELTRMHLRVCHPRMMLVLHKWRTTEVIRSIAKLLDVRWWMMPWGRWMMPNHIWRVLCRAKSPADRERWGCWSPTSCGSIQGGLSWHISTYGKNTSIKERDKLNGKYHAKIFIVLTWWGILTGLLNSWRHWISRNWHSRWTRKRVLGCRVHRLENCQEVICKKKKWGMGTEWISGMGKKRRDLLTSALKKYGHQPSQVIL